MKQWGHDERAKMRRYGAVTNPVPMAERLSRPDLSADPSCVTDPGIECSEGNADNFAAAVADDGRRVAFHSHPGNLVPEDDNDFQDVFVKFRFGAGNNYHGIAGPIVRVSISSLGVQANDGSVQVAISGNGQFVAFRSLTTNLVPADNNPSRDIFRAANPLIGEGSP